MYVLKSHADGMFYTAKTEKAMHEISEQGDTVFLASLKKIGKVSKEIIVRK